MKYIIVFLSFFTLSPLLFAQSAQDSVPIYKQFPQVPAFSLYQYPDSIIFKKADLKKNRATIIMIFSPDCDHCRMTTENMLANMNKLKKAQIVMVSSLPFKWMKPFYDQLHLGDYKNITVAYQATYFLNEFYRIKSFPSIFVYNKKGAFAGNYENSADFSKIAELIK